MKKNLIALIGVVLILASCVTEIQFDTEVENFLVIGGVISNSPTEKVITVSRTTGVGTQPAPVQATGQVFKDGAPWRELDILAPGELALPAFLDIEEGASYVIEIITEDGSTYRSEPQVVQPLLKTENLSFDVSTRVSGINFEGNPIFRRFVDVYATVTIPAPSGADIRPNYRWQVDESWLVEEIPNAIENPDLINCYVTNSVGEFPSTVLNIEDISAGESIVLVAIRLLDTSFRKRHYFNVYLHSIDTRAVQYYQNSQRLVSNNGTIYDEVPALVKGNLFNVDDPSERVLGYVEFSLSDTTRLAIDYGQINEEVFYYCEDSDDPCPQLPLPQGGTTRANCECFECDSIYGQQTRQRPFYWED